MRVYSAELRVPQRRRGWREGRGSGCGLLTFLPALLTTFLPAVPEALVVGHAAGEVVNGEPGVEIVRPVDIEPGIGKGFELAEGKGPEAGLLGRAEQSARPAGRRRLPGTPAPADRVRCHDGTQCTEGKRCPKSPANALIASGSIENTIG